MIKVFREYEELVGVTVGGKMIEIEDASEDYVLAECSIDDLDGEVAGDWPKGLSLCIHSENGFGTFFFYDLHLGSDNGDVILDFECHTPNKYWEGHYGLAAFIQALRNQVEYADNLQVTRFEVEDDWKGITLQRRLADGDPIPASIQTAAESISLLMRQAEIALGGIEWKPEHANNENLFCREILEPLLRRMNFLFVRYTHGRREYGKDFTFSENTPFGGQRHYGLQAKAGNVSGGVNAQIDELIGQVNDAFSMPFYELGSADKRYISTFVIAISGQFTENAREKIVEKIPAPLLGSVWFLDRTRIDELIERYWHNKQSV
jgi:hypothetical protein